MHKKRILFCNTAKYRRSCSRFHFKKKKEIQKTPAWYSSTGVIELSYQDFNYRDNNARF